MNTITTVFKAIGDTRFGHWAVKHAPKISIALGGLLGAGAIATTVIATKRTCDQITVEKEKRAVAMNSELQEKAKKDGTVPKNVTKDDIHLTPGEVIKLSWKNFIIPAGLAAGSLVADIAAYKFEHKKTLVVAGLLSGSEARLLSVEKEMAEKLGEKKAEEIKKKAHERTAQEEAAKDSNKENPDATKSPGFNALEFVHYTESITQFKFDSKPSNIALAITKADSYLKDDYLGCITFNQWMQILEAATGKDMPRSAIGENLVFKKKDTSTSFEDFVRVAYYEAPGYEPACEIEYRNFDRWEWVD